MSFLQPRIGIVGTLGSGKTDLSDVGVQLGLQKLSLAAPLKQMVDFLAPLYGWDISTKPLKRPHAQNLGMSGRSYDPEFWVRYMAAKHDLTDMTQGYGYIVDDIRFPNEAVELKKLGFHIIRLQVSDTERRRRILLRDGSIDERAFQHPSETEIANVQHDELWSNETQEDRERNLKALADMITTWRATPSPEEYDVA